MAEGWACDKCSSSTKKQLWHLRWWNGVLKVNKWLCDACCDPEWRAQIRLQGGSVTRCVVDEEAG